MATRSKGVWTTEKAWNDQRRIDRWIDMELTERVFVVDDFSQAARSAVLHPTPSADLDWRPTQWRHLYALTDRSNDSIKILPVQPCLWLTAIRRRLSRFASLYLFSSLHASAIPTEPTVTLFSSFGTRPSRPSTSASMEIHTPWTRGKAPIHGITRNFVATERDCRKSFRSRRPSLSTKVENLIFPRDETKSTR